MKLNLKSAIKLFGAFGICVLFSNPAFSKTEKADFAGGCFWCMQPAFDRLKSEGVISTTVGYTGGTKKDPKYEEVSSGTTGHREAIEVTFESTRISYEKLLDVFWENVDPVDATGQFCDHGEQYTSAIFFQDENQKTLATQSQARVTPKLKVKGEIKTKIIQANAFFPAETYHQSYYQKNPIRYRFYRSRCGRDQRLKEVWGKEPVHG